MQDFLVEDRPISRVGDHLTGSLAEPDRVDLLQKSRENEDKRQVLRPEILIDRPLGYAASAAGSFHARGVNDAFESRLNAYFTILELLILGVQRFDPSPPPQERHFTLMANAIKHDGYRAQGHLNGARPLIYTRNGYDWTQRFARIAEALKQLTSARLLPEDLQSRRLGNPSKPLRLSAT
jgi:hypothetical protein